MQFLKSSITLLLGNFVAPTGHIQFFLSTIPKDKHELSKNDLPPIIKLNFQSIPKLCDPKVMDQLMENGPGSEGNVAYLETIY